MSGDDGETDTVEEQQCDATVPVAVPSRRRGDRWGGLTSCLTPFQNPNVIKVKRTTPPFEQHLLH